MSVGNYSHVVRFNFRDPTTAEYNEDNQRHLDNKTPRGVGHASENIANMGSVFFEQSLGSEILPVSYGEELRSIRLIIEQITGRDKWYESPAKSLDQLSNYRFLYTKGSSQTFSNNSSGDINFETQVFDPRNVQATGDAGSFQLTTGLWQIAANVTVANNNTGIREVAIRSGVLNIAKVILGANASSETYSVNISTLSLLTSDKTHSVSFRQTSGGNLDVLATGSTWIGGTRLR